MRTIMFVLTGLLIGGILNAQSGRGWWKVDDYGLEYKLPKDWQSDPFSTSSVCNCSGTINDNGGWEAADYLGMVIYPSKNDEDRSQVWGSDFVGNTDADTLEFAGIPYLSTYGTMEDLRLGEAAWQLISLDKAGKNYMDLTIYFIGNPKLFEKRKDVFVQILETFERTKVKW
ncbi:MAG: hypothetical protein GY751_11255 [Bacteroidetes bacterium]|nr:hypothetical protein [Bacteroidota bacterium]